jgi:amino acid permease
MRREVFKSAVWGLIVTVLLGAAILVGSRSLSRFDSALVAYFRSIVCRLWAYLSLLNVAATTSDRLVLASWLGSFLQAPL